MSALENPTEMVSQNLQKAIDDLRRDITKVEIWAEALSGFSRPIPEYEVSGAKLLPPTHSKNPARSAARG